MHINADASINMHLVKQDMFLLNISNNEYEVKLQSDGIFTKTDSKLNELEKV